MSPEGPLRDRHGPGFQLIETLRWEKALGFVRLEHHLARLEASADALGFAYSASKAQAALSEAVDQGTATAQPRTAAMLRLRLTLDRAGHAAATGAPFSPSSANTVWRLAIAKTRLDSSDQFLRHKTTRRALYDAARAEFTPEQADEVLLLNERGELCEGTVTSVFVDAGTGGPLLTPPLRCGLLAGVLRAEMLDTGRAVEQVLLSDDLTAARVVHVGNSLRELMPATLVAASA